jgi:hypothetical protein
MTRQELKRTRTFFDFEDKIKPFLFVFLLAFRLPIRISECTFLSHCFIRKDLLARIILIFSVSKIIFIAFE